MSKLLVFAGSNSSQSINRALATYASLQLEGFTKIALDLNDFAMPIYSADIESTDGIPEPAKAFVAEIETCDGIILSLAEHNGSYSAAFKNVYDWASRVKQDLWSNKPMLLMATSPGKRGGANVLGAASGYFPHMGGNITATFSLPSFNTTFDKANGITDADLKAAFDASLAKFTDALKS